MKRIGFIGAGKLGTSLGAYFYNKSKIKISGYYSNQYKDSEYASKITYSQAFSRLEDLVNNSEIIIISTPDDSIKNVWETLYSFDIKNKIICHLSGSLTSEIFFDISKKGAFSASLHPMFAVSSKNASEEFFSDVFFTVEGDKKALEELMRILDITNNRYKVIKKEDKVKYHLSSVFISNFVVFLSKISVDLLTDCGFSEDEALNSLKTLAVGNLINIFSNGIEKSLTGPVERCDVNTIMKHINAIKDKDIEKIYKLLSNQILDIAEKKKPQLDYESMKKILKE